jgi:hypothetical protein
VEILVQREIMFDRSKEKYELGDMPRLARMHAPGPLHHVMGRGVEGISIFRWDDGREDFLTQG